MKKFISVLYIGALVSISGCIKATKDYDDYVAYHNSLGGTVADFARGYSAAAQGDLFGPALDVMDEDQRLDETKGNWKMWAWILTGSAVFFSFVAAGKKPEQV